MPWHMRPRIVTGELALRHFVCGVEQTHGIELRVDQPEDASAVSAGDVLRRARRGSWGGLLRVVAHLRMSIGDRVRSCRRKMHDRV